MSRHQKVGKAATIKMREVRRDGSYYARLSLRKVPKRLRALDQEEENEHRDLFGLANITAKRIGCSQRGPLLAQSRHINTLSRCLLWETKRTASDVIEPFAPKAITKVRRLVSVGAQRRRCGLGGSPKQRGKAMAKTYLSIK
jgi:hypothetical protein